MSCDCECVNNYDKETFMESFGKNDDDIKKCSNCDNMTYHDGIMTCNKFDM